MKRLIMALLSVFFVAFAAGCGKDAAQPVAVAAGVDKCAHCNMMVPDDHNAAEIILKDGKALKFDDIGCLNAWVTKNGKDQVAVQYVRDYHSKEWVKLENASFAYDKEFKTPMAYGIFSFKDSKEAQKFVDEQKRGKVLSAGDLASHSWERNMDMMKEMKMHQQEGSNSNGQEQMQHGQEQMQHGQDQMQHGK